MIGDVLHLCNNDSSRLLEKRVGVPVRVKTLQNFCDAVVLANPQDVHHSQARLLVYPGIP